MPNVETSTQGTYLMYKATSSAQYTKLVDIIDFPDMGGEAEQVEISTLSDRMDRFVKGRQKLTAPAFLANYMPDDYQLCLGLEGKQIEYSLWFDEETKATPAGTFGKFDFTGDMSVFIVGAGGNAARQMKLTISTSTEIVPVLQ